MDVIILDKVRTMDVVSITINSDKKDPEGKKVKMWFCPNCQNPCFQYTGKLISVVPGSTPSPVRVIIKCLRCGTIYQINDIL